MGKGKKLSPEQKAANEKARAAQREALKSLSPEQKAEMRHSNFVRLANQRVSKVMAQIANIGNLSAPAYSFSEEEVTKIFGAIRKVTQDAESRFSAKPKEKKGFSL